MRLLTMVVKKRQQGQLKNTMLVVLVLVLVNGVVLALDCPDDGNCVLLTPSNDSGKLLKSMSMVVEDQVEHLSPTVEKPKGKALNLTINDKPHKMDLSDVTINDDEDMGDQQSAKILSPKDTGNFNTTIGRVCYKGGLTYEHGEKLETDCDSICTCNNGKMDCTDRCTGPFFRRGKKIEDPLCTAKDVDTDPCCSILICAADTETEPLEICTYGNQTYHRGEKFNKGCNEVCTCEIAGKSSCKARCPPIMKTSDRCVEVQDPNDTCCKKLLCDVSLDEHEPDNKDHKLMSAKYVNSSTVELKFEPPQPEDTKDNFIFIDGSADKQSWNTYSVRSGQYVEVMTGTKYLKMENSDQLIEIQDEKLDQQNSPRKSQKSDSCMYSGKVFKLNEEFNDNCTSLCVCKDTGMQCLKIECPTYFGVDVIDPNCIEWETVPPNFVPSPPNCCPEEIKCKRNGSCTFKDEIYPNWQQIPTNVTGCQKRCYCEMGNVECHDACPPVEALPPPTLPCPPYQAMVGHSPDDDCCVAWICKSGDNQTDSGRNDNLTKETSLPNKDDQYSGTFSTVKEPSKNMGPLLVYANENNIQNSDKKLEPPKRPNVTAEENPFYHKVGPNNSNAYKKPLTDKTKIGQKPTAPNKPVFVTPPPNNNNNNYNGPYSKPPINHQPLPPQIHQPTNTDELLQFINQHPEIANYPSGSVLEIHNIPQKQPPFINHNGVHPLPNGGNNRPIVPYVIPQQHGHVEDLPPGVTLDQILQHVHRNAFNPYSNGPPVLVAPQTNIRQNHTSYQGGSMFPGNYPNVPDVQQHEEISVQTLEAIDAHTVRLAFTVHPLLVGLHGRVQVRYTHHDNPDVNTWELQVFAPPGDLIATPQLEFDLVDLLPDTKYKIKIIVSMRDLSNAPESRIYETRTPRDTATTLPPKIPIEPELAISDINATWVKVSWRRFTEYELQFIDGVQLSYREVDVKIYDATPLLHRLVNNYVLENLKANTKYEIKIILMPFAGQATELFSEHSLHFTTANEVDTYGFNVTLEVGHIKPTSVEIGWSGVPYPEDKYVNVYRAIYQTDSGKEDQSTFKIAKRDSPTKTVIMDLKPGTRYRLWLEVYLTNGKIKTSNVQDFITKPRAAPALGATSIQSGEHTRENKGDYYGPLVIVAILASIAILSTLILLLILVRRHNQNKAAITPPTRISQSAYDNPTYKVEIQQETMGL